MKPKARTLIQRFGLSDPDLRSSVHDTMVLALMNKEKMLDVLEATAWKNLSIEKPRCHTYEAKGENYCFQDANLIGEQLKKDAIKQLTETHPNISPQKWTLTAYLPSYQNSVYVKCEMNIKCEEIMFDDSVFDSALCKKNLNFEKCEKHYINMEEISKISVLHLIKISEQLIITPEYTITGRNKYIIGFIDFKVGLKEKEVYARDDYGNKLYKNRIEETLGSLIFTAKNIPTVFLEIKPEIKSFGETLRQINMYREFCNGEFVLVTGTDRADYNKAFNDAGVHVYHWT